MLIVIIRICQGLSSYLTTLWPTSSHGKICLFFNIRTFHATILLSKPLLRDFHSHLLGLGNQPHPRDADSSDQRTWSIPHLGYSQLSYSCSLWSALQEKDHLLSGTGSSSGSYLHQSYPSLLSGHPAQNPQRNTLRILWSGSFLSHYRPMRFRIASMDV